MSGEECGTPPNCGGAHPRDLGPGRDADAGDRCRRHADAGDWAEPEGKGGYGPDLVKTLRPMEAQWGRPGSEKDIVNIGEINTLHLHNGILCRMSVRQYTTLSSSTSASYLVLCQWFEQGGFRSVKPPGRKI